MKKCSVIVPCYNEENNIKMLVDSFAQIVQINDIELILVDNGSLDGTQREINNQISRYNFIKLVVVKKNKGYGYGILKGLEKATGETLGWIHADMQSDPSVFIGMIKSSDSERGDFLYKGARTNRSIMSNLFTNGMAIFETVLFKRKLTDVNSQPTLVSRGFYEKWENPPIDFSLDLYVYVLALKKGINVCRFESKQRERLAGKSSWNNGFFSKLKMIKRVVCYSINVKKIIKDMN